MNTLRRNFPCTCTNNIVRIINRKVRYCFSQFLCSLKIEGGNCLQFPRISLIDFQEKVKQPIVYPYAYNDKKTAY